MKNKLLQITILGLLFLGYSAPWSPDRKYEDPFMPAFPEDPPFVDSGREWVDSVMQEMSLEERIAQMFMVYAYSNMGADHERSVLRQVTRQKVGGILFFQGDPVSQARMTNQLQSASRVPLLIAIDGENGLGMRLKNTITYPQMMALGSVTDNQLLYRMGSQMAEQFKRLGVQLNFAPVADINSNPSNPVIGIRSFGEDRQNVANKVVSVMKGMQDHGLLVAAKHFPGHGDTDTDSHRALPLLDHDARRLDSMELYPFREAIRNGLTGIMVAHLHVPSLDPRPGRATTLSYPTITGLLKEKMDFKGLIITDALNMKGISEHVEPGEREVEAVQAGNDILLMPSDVGKAITAIKRAIRRGEIEEERINSSCRKILQAKYWAGLSHWKEIPLEGLLRDLNFPRYLSLNRELVEHSLILVKNRNNLLPLGGLDRIRLATVTIGQDASYREDSATDLYVEGKHFRLGVDADNRERNALLEKLRGYNTLIINIICSSARASKGYGISDATVEFVERLDTASSLILNVAGIPYALNRFSHPDHMDAIIISHDGGATWQDYVAQALFGGRSFTGRLPVSAGPGHGPGKGVSTGTPIRFGYGEPADVQLNADTLQKMSGIIRKAIDSKAIPGCQVLVARKGKVVWHKAYGYHTYLKRRPVELTDIYDLASITKMTATLAALMRLRDLGLFHEDSLLGAYDPVPGSSNKAGLLISDVLTHQAGLIAWIPYYQLTMEPLDTSQSLIAKNWSPIHPLKLGEGSYANRNVRFKDGYYQSHYSREYPYQVAENLYMRRDLRDSIFKWNYDSELVSREYRYSGLGFYMFHQIIESVTDTMLYPYVWYNFYDPMGAHTLGYKPLSRFPKDRIVPTENDLFFRRQLLQGHVHDPGAAMLGGVSGNAGLFGCANDLAKMMQMYLNRGWYGERRYIDSTTLDLYTSCYNCDDGNRRGLGFDRPVKEEEEEGPACDSASEKSFGHSGFTGTLAWVDPEYDLVFVFLSNRVHPNQANNKLIDMNIRTAVQQVVYDAIEREGPTEKTEPE